MTPHPSVRRPRVAPAALVLALVVVPLLAAACGSNSTNPNALVATWTLTEVTTSKGKIAVPGGGSLAQVTFAADGRLTGSTGCNTFGGTWSTEGDTLKFAAIGMTSKACTDEIPSMIETAFSVAFSKSQTWAVRDDRLTIAAADGSTSLSFTHVRS